VEVTPGPAPDPLAGGWLFPPRVATTTLRRNLEDWDSPEVLARTGRGGAGKQSDPGAGREGDDRRPRPGERIGFVGGSGNHTSFSLIWQNMDGLRPG